MTRGTLRDILILTLLSAIVYFVAPASFGLTNWQEAKRALVAREMYERLKTDSGAWLVPTDGGKPYLAKPPLIYWCQVALAKVRGQRPNELDLRLTVAIAGWLGVLATYWAGRRVLSLHDAEHPQPDAERWARRAAFWGAAMLGTGTLYVRSSRFGELDVLLVPFTSAAVAMLAVAWKSAIERKRTHLAAVAGAAVCAMGAAMTKGPPGVLTLGLAAYGGMALLVAHRSRAVRPVSAAWTWIACMAAAGLVAWPSARQVDERADWIGMVLMSAMAAWTAWALLPLARWAAFKQFCVLCARTHPVGVIGAGLGVLWWWSHVVAKHIGDSGLASSVAEEIEDNLRLLVPDSPLINLGAAAYGVAMGSAAAIIAIIWIIKDRPRFPLGMSMVFAWAGLGLVAFSLLGKGVPRYLTPVWPGIAIMGGAWVSAAIRDFRNPVPMRIGWTLGVVVLGLSQGWWYAFGLEAQEHDRSPRAMVSEILTRGTVASDMVTFEFSTPAIDYYAERDIESLLDVVERPGIRFVGPRTIAELKTDLERDPSRRVTMLVRRTQPPTMDSARAVERLRALGFEIEPIGLNSEFTIDNGRTAVDAVRVSVVPK